MRADLGPVTGGNPASGVGGEHWDWWRKSAQREAWVSLG